MHRQNEVIIMQPTNGMNNAASLPGHDLVPRSGEGRLWKHGVFDCCNDTGVCVTGFFYPGCLMCKVLNSMDECGFCVCVAGGAISAIWARARIRAGLHIKGSLYGDFCCTAYCFSCVACQMYKELRDNGQLNDKLCANCSCDGEKHTYCK